MQLFVTTITAGITLGLLYSLFAAGMGLVMRGAGEFNLAHGDLLVLAAFIGIGGTTASRNALVVIPVAVLVGAALGAIVYRAVYAPVARHHGSGGTALLSFLPSLGVALIARNVAEVVAPAGSRPVGDLLPGPSIDVFGSVVLPPVTVWVVAAALIVPAALGLLLTRSSWGMNLRAVSDDPALAQLSGVPVHATLTATYAVAGALGALGGVLYGAFFGQLSTSLGWQATLAAFVAVVVGGARNVWGWLFGALFVAVMGSLAGAYVSTDFKDVAVFVLLIAVLIVTPSGLRRVRPVRSA